MRIEKVLHHVLKIDKTHYVQTPFNSFKGPTKELKIPTNGEDSVEEGIISDSDHSDLIIPSGDKSQIFPLADVGQALK